ncbi:MAG: HD domain-containing protein [bacterium]
MKIMLKILENYRIIQAQITETKNGKPMAKLLLEAGDNTYNCVIWQEYLDKLDKKILKQGNLVKVNDIDYNEKFKTTSINSLELIEEAGSGISKQQAEIYLNDIFQLIDNFSNDKLRDALKKVIFENLDAFLTTPAAEKMHHNYKGGLIRHIWECLNIANSTLPVLNDKIDKDLVFAGCIMHDFGKIFEYIFNEETESASRNNEFKKIWINHIYWGFSWANNNNLPELAHIIASHHGIKDWGALVEPVSLEANLVHQVDMISSRCGAISLNSLKVKTEEKV